MIAKCRQSSSRGKDFHTLQFIQIQFALEPMASLDYAIEQLEAGDPDVIGALYSINEVLSLSNGKREMLSCDADMRLVSSCAVLDCIFSIFTIFCGVKTEEQLPSHRVHRLIPLLVNLLPSDASDVQCMSE
jgi:hypothetical protein